MTNQALDRNSQGRSAAAPDVTAVSYQDQAVAVGEYAQEAFNSVLAQYRFLGLLAGIQGPNDTDADVTNARNAVMEAIAEVLRAGPLEQQIGQKWAEVQGTRDGLQERIFERMRAGDHSMAVMSANSLLDNLVRGHPSDQSETMLEAIASGALRQNYRDQVQSVPAALRGDFERLINQQQALATLEDARRGARRAAIAQYFKDIWTGIKSYYDEKMALIANGQWLLAVGTTAVDLALAVAEEVIVDGIVVAIIAISGGIAAGMGLALRSAVRLMITVGAKGARGIRGGRAARAFKIELRKVEVGDLSSEAMPFNVTAGPKLPYEKTIDVDADLTDAERRAVGEGGQGSHDPDADAPEGDSAGRKSSGEIGKIAERQAAKDLADRGFKDQKTIQNLQGNGVDIIARDPSTGEIMFGEVKANTARLSPVQADLGGPEYVRDRLTRTISGDAEWASATPSQKRDAAEALEWLKQNPAFKEIKYDVDPITGKVSNYRERDWDYKPGERARALPWRNSDGVEVTGKGTPKKQSARGPPRPAAPRN